MPATAEQMDLITADLIEAFQNKFGEHWRENLIRNLTPSPNQAIAEKRGVRVSDVKKARHRLMILGMVNRALAWSQQAQEEEGGQEHDHQPATMIS